VKTNTPDGSRVPLFKSKQDWAAWLEKNHGKSTGLCFFETVDRANRYAVLWRIQTVKKAETRARKIEQFIGMLERKEKIHP
jgi:hypothetical protein